LIAAPSRDNPTCQLAISPDSVSENDGEMQPVRQPDRDEPALAVFPSPIFPDQRWPTEDERGEPEVESALS
jgi:hypothetical protein